MVNWSQAVDDALLGARGMDAPDGDYAGCTAEQALLKRLALAGAARRAGFVASTVKKLPEADPAPPETQPTCSMRAVDMLFRFSQAGFLGEPLVCEWFLIIARKGKRVPHSALPQLFALSEQIGHLAPFFVHVLGARGRWLLAPTKSFLTLQRALEHPIPLDQLQIPEIPNALKQQYPELRQRLVEGLANE